MTTRTLPSRLHLNPSLTDRWLVVAQHALARWLERRAERREADLAMAVERELQQLDPRTLADIGAPQGLVGQRRWQAEQDAWSRDHMLRIHG
jgi:uncharacterized protein YjiS (DUF1127 family)